MRRSMTRWQGDQRAPAITSKTGSSGLKGTPTGAKSSRKGKKGVAPNKNLGGGTNHGSSRR